MEMTEIVERMTAVEQRAKSNSHRLDALEALAEAIHHQGKASPSCVLNLKLREKP